MFQLATIVGGFFALVHAAPAFSQTPEKNSGEHHTATMTESAYRALPNLLSNPSFEMDWMHNQVSANTRFLLLEQSDWGYSQSDGLPDNWVIRGVPPKTRQSVTARRFGKASLQLQGTASQVVYLCGETESRSGGAFYSPFRPLSVSLARSLRSRPLRIGVWCKTQDVIGQPELKIALECSANDRIISKPYSVAFSKGTHDWEYQEIVVPVSAELGLPHAAVVTLSYQGRGTAWFDGAYVVEDASPDTPNLLPNGSFEAVEKDWPTGWSKPEVWSWSRSDYYRFTGWSHGDGQMKGGASVIPAGRNVGKSLQLTVLPGDNLAVKSLPVVLNQKEAHVLEVCAWVRTDNLRWMEIMAKDEKGEWLPQQDFAGFWGSDEHYRNRIFGTGSHDWEFVRKHFAPQKPVKEVTLWLCARGMDGKLMQRNVVGTIWFDDVELYERGTSRAELERRGVKIPQLVPSDKSSYVIRDLDLGERLVGMNEMRLRVWNPLREPIIFGVEGQLLGPNGTSQPISGTPAKLPGETGTAVVIPYRVTDLCPNWQQQYRISQPWPVYFGTPPAAISIRQSGSYVYPDEKLDVGINLNISQTSLKDVASCEVFVTHTAGKKVILDTNDIPGVLWNTDSEQPPLLQAGHVDAKNLISLRIDSKELPIHGSPDPVRDCRVVVILKDKNKKPIVTQTSKSFGFLEKPTTPKLPDKIERTQVVEGGILLVNNKPFTFNCFPYSQTDLGNVSRMLNFPKTHKILPLPFPKELTFSTKEEATWKKQVQGFVKEHQNDPKLFGYFFQHDGETTFWLKQWKEMAACQRKAATWVREVDSNHVIMGAEWLFGHEGLTPEIAKSFNYLDVLDVEPGLTWTPDSQGVRREAGRPIAVIAGLECYYFQSTDMLRWRTYEALRKGANGVGICPSGMLHSRPETVSFLRGLHAEVAALQGMLTGMIPPTASKSSNVGITHWERQDGKTRYLVAMLGDKQLAEKDRQVAFTLPLKATKVDVLFEGRSLPVVDRQFTDDFVEPFTVRIYRVIED
jgi:hypothetical protein